MFFFAYSIEMQFHIEINNIKPTILILVIVWDFKFFDSVCFLQGCYNSVFDPRMDKLRQHMLHENTKLGTFTHNRGPVLKNHKMYIKQIHELNKVTYNGFYKCRMNMYEANIWSDWSYIIIINTVIYIFKGLFHILMFENRTSPRISRKCVCPIKPGKA